MLRHTFLRGLPGLALLAATAPASAQAPSQGQFPGSTPITLVIPYPAGGIGDYLTRLVSKKLGEELGEDLASRPGPTAQIKAELRARHQDFVSAHQQLEWFQGETHGPVASLGEVRTLGALPARRHRQRTEAQKKQPPVSAGNSESPPRQFPPFHTTPPHPALRRRL